MDLDMFVKWLSVPAVLIAGLAWWESRRAIKVGRAYNDPVFIMECTPRDWGSEGTGPGSRGLDVEFRLINKGKSPAMEVDWSMDFDPHNLYAQDQHWHIIHGEGGVVPVYTQFRASTMESPVLGEILSKGNGADLCTVTYTTQSGEKKKTQIRLPNPYDFWLPSPQESV